MRFTTVLFDLDHTLLDSDTSEALAFDATLRPVGIEDPALHLAAYRELNTRLWREVELGERSPNDIKTRRFELLFSLLELDHDPVVVGEQYLRNLGDHGDLYPEAIALLDELRPVQIGLVTNGIGSVQRRRVERLGLTSYLDALAISGEVGVAKPDPSIFDHLGFESLDPADTVMIGDSLTSDIAAGANAGMATCWYNPTNKPMNGPAEPTVEVDSLADIPAALSSI